MPISKAELPGFVRRFEKFISPEPNTGCWLWAGSLSSKTGYGNFHVSQHGKQTKVRSAHRVSYEINRGEIPQGTELDHLCRVRSCVNPAHLEPVTRSVNQLRGANCVKSTCPRGHDYILQRGFRSNGKSYCAQCARVNAKVQKAKKRAKING